MEYIIEKILYGAKFDEAFGMIRTVTLQKSMVYSMRSSIKVSLQDGQACIQKTKTTSQKQGSQFTLSVKTQEISHFQT